MIATAAERNEPNARARTEKYTVDEMSATDSTKRWERIRGMIWGNEGKLA